MSATGQDRERSPLETRHALFVGDSFTHGRYLPVRTYNNIPGTGGIGSTAPSPYVVDENFGTNVPGRMEQPDEYSPWGGIPGIFAELAFEANLSYDVHIEAISATTLAKNHSLAADVINRPIWDAVVLQEASFEAIPSSLTYNPDSDPQLFCEAVKSIEHGVHAVAANADVYLYATWAPADTAYLEATANETLPFSSDQFLRSLAKLTIAYHKAYESAAAYDGHIRAVAHVGDAWALAWSEGVANPDPYDGSTRGVNLSFGYQPESEPPTKDVPTDAGFHHPSIYGSYLSGLVLFETMTGIDARKFGLQERAAAQRGVPAKIAVALQQIAWESVRTQHTNAPVETTSPSTARK